VTLEESLPFNGTNSFEPVSHVLIGKLSFDFTGKGTFGRILAMGHGNPCLQLAYTEEFNFIETLRPEHRPDYLGLTSTNVESSGSHSAYSGLRVPVTLSGDADL